MQPQQQQQKPQQQQQQQQRAAPKKPEGVLAFVPLQSVKQQRNAKSAALLRQEHLSSQAEVTGGTGAPSAPELSSAQKEAQPNKGAQTKNNGNETSYSKNQTLPQEKPSQEVTADSQERETNKPVDRKSPKKHESEDRKVRTL